MAVQRERPNRLLCIDVVLWMCCRGVFTRLCLSLLPPPATYNLLPLPVPAHRHTGATGTQSDGSLRLRYEKHIPNDAIMTVDLVSSAATKCTAGKRITMHPQYEFKRVRDRDARYSIVYGMSTDKEVYDVISNELNSDYFAITLTSCFMVPGETQAINNKILAEKGPNFRRIPNWCTTVAPRFVEITNTIVAMDPIPFATSVAAVGFSPFIEAVSIMITVNKTLVT